MTSVTGANNTNRNFKGQLADEVVVSFTRKHWLRTSPYFLMLLGIVSSPFILAFFLDKASMQDTMGQGGVFTLTGLYGLVVTYLMHISFVRIFNYYLRVLIITNQRIIDLKKTLFLKDHRSVIMLTEVQDIATNKDGIFQTIFNFGSIEIMVSGSSQTIRLNQIPNPTYHLTKIIKARQELISRLAGFNTHSQVVSQIDSQITQTQLAPQAPLQKSVSVILPVEPVDARPFVLPTFTV